MTTVVLSDTKEESNRRVRDVLDQAGIDTVVEVCRSADEIVTVAEQADATGLIVDANTPVTGGVLARAGSLRVVARAGIGVDNIDIEAAAAHGVTVLNVPDYCIEEVSTHTLGLLVACVRRLSTYDRDTRAGNWDWEAGRPLRRLDGRTVALLGLGNIGRRTAEKLRGFDVTILACDPYLDVEAFPDWITRVDFETALARADILSIHVPLTPETRGLIDDDALTRLGGDVPEGAILVNTARGGVVDERALAVALDDGTVATAGLDVLAEEPPDESPVVDHPDTIVTPHIGWYSEDSRDDLAAKVAQDVVRVIRGEEARSPVDPEQGW